MREILLTQGKVALVDDEDFEQFNQFKWRAWKHRNNYYACRNGKTINGKKSMLLMHREVLNAPLGIQGDHRNGNGLDNQKHNLRLATHTQNMHNRKNAHKNNKLGIKGVCWHKKVKKFRAQIKINGKKINLGFFNVLGDADSAYRKAEEKYFGEFARKVG